MHRRQFLWLAGAAALAGCERPAPTGTAAAGKSWRVILYDLKSGQEIGNKTTAPLPDRQSYRMEANPSFGFVDAAHNDTRLIEADNARVHPLENGLSRVVWFQPNSCISGREHTTILMDLTQDKVVWENSEHEATEGRLVANGVVLVPQSRTLAALDLATGKTLWNEEGLGQPGILQATKDQAVVGLYHLNRVEFRDLRTGKLSGTIELPHPGAIPSQASVVGDLLLLACPHVGIFAYRGDKLVWQFKLKEEEYYPRLYGGDSSVCLFAPDFEVIAVSTDTGKKLWSGPGITTNDCGLASGVWVAHVADPKTRVPQLIASDLKTGKSLWQKEMPRGSSISVNDRRVAVLRPA